MVLRPAFNNGEAWRWRTGVNLLRAVVTVAWILLLLIQRDC